MRRAAEISRIVSLLYLRERGGLETIMCAGERLIGARCPEEGGTQRRGAGGKASHLILSSRYRYRACFERTRLLTNYVFFLVRPPPFTFRVKLTSASICEGAEQWLRLIGDRAPPRPHSKFVCRTPLCPS